MKPALILPEDFTKVVKKLREYFDKKGFLEVHTQNRLSILAACEDPKTIATFDYTGHVWPLPQTGQMWLEYELLSNPNLTGVYCLSTSYRNEPHPKEGRHDIIFPMFEFEAKGNLDDLIQLEKELCEHLGFGPISTFKEGNYVDIAEKYGVTDISHEEEERLETDFGKVFFLKNFPEHTSPFWNMKRNEKDASISNKVDVIMHGMETIGSAERSCDAKDMLECFNTISEGKYAEQLFHYFGKERVMKEMDEFLSFDFFPRFGGGIGFTRMIRAMKNSNLI